MLVVGENISVTSKIVGESIRNRDAGPILEMVKAQKDAGANYIDINIGPATKNGEDLMQWIVKTIQAEYDVLLALDTKNTSAIEAGLQVHKGTAMINSVTGDKDKLDILMPMAKKYNAKIVGIALSEKGVPPDVDSRIEVIMNIVNSAIEHGVMLSDVYLDPIALPVAVLQQQVYNCIEGLKAFKQLKDLMGLNEEPKTIVGLSNVSQSSPAHLKSLLNRTYLLILLSHGLDSAIMDPLDSELMNAVKTFDILTNRILYAHSYLD
ncbi:MAG: dihydropteroate synthase DHPS [Actinobacteria bacterium]|nr:dihydropteroate synthase DHPS [Actinomycetota bacterium]